MKAKLIQSYSRFRRLPTYLKVRFFFGSVSLIIGLLATNLAIFGWNSPESFFSLSGEGSYYLLGEYARYVCAYGGLGATIFGAMLINDFLVLRKLINEFFALKASIAIKRNTKRSATEWLIRARTEWRLCVDFDKLCSMEPGISQDDFFVQTGEEIEVVADK
jgi:hypothetical protein